MRLRLQGACCFLIVWMHWVGVLFAQSPAFTHYSLDNGLASSIVYATIQDREGFIWFATESGVSRFDGTTFQNYTVAQGLTANDVLNIYEDHQGRIWCFPFHPEICYIENGVIHNPKTDPWLAQARAGNFFPTFLEDSAHNLWLADEAGHIMCVSPATKTVTPAPNVDCYIYSFWALYQNSPKKLMAFSNSGIFEVNTGRFVSPVELQADKWFPPRIIRLNPETHLVAMESDAVLIVEDQIHLIPLPSEYFYSEILCVKQDHSGNLWFGTRDGAVVLSDVHVNGTTLEFSGVRRLLQGKAITSVLQDHEGNYWMSSMGVGVFFFPSIHAVTLQPYRGTKEFFSNKVLIARNGDVWVGFEKSKFGKLSGDSLQLFQFPSSKGRGRINDIYEDRDGNIFFAMDETLGIIMPDGQIQMTSIFAKAFIQDSAGYYYISHGWSVNRVKNVSPELFAAAYEDASHRQDGWYVRAASLACLSNGKLLMGTLNGLLETQGSQVLPVPQVPKTTITDMMAISDSLIWLSTMSEGIGYLANGKFHGIRARDGLASDICNGITRNEKGVIFVATNRGISRIELVDSTTLEAGFRIQNFGKNFGLVSDEVRGIAAGNGKIYAATAKGLTVLDEDYLTEIPPPVRLHIMAVSTGGKTLQWEDAPLQLSHRENHLALSFTAISFRNTGRVTYSYRLDHGDTEGEWLNTAARQLDFPYLKPGRYTLHLKAMIEGIPATASVVELKFEVLPAFWQTVAFTIAMIALIVAFLALIFWFVLSRLKARERKRTVILRRIAELEHRALRSQMNPHFIFNSLNSIEKFYIQDRDEEANSFIADFSDLIRAILELSAKPFVTLAEELRLVELFLSLESHRMDHRFDYEITVDGQANTHEIMVPPLILQPFVENSIWHGISPLEQRKGKIQVSVLVAEGGTTITIHDNGIGRKKSEELKSKYRKKHRSSGIRITKERLDLLNLDVHSQARCTLHIHDLEDEHHAATGTEVVIFFPHLLHALPS